MFSVLVPAFNARNTIGMTLDSLLNQTSSDWEAIIADDGSTDDTLAIARAYAADDERFKVISKENGGTASAVTAAAKEARGELLVQLDADDEFLPRYIERISQMASDYPEYGIYASNAYRLLPNGEKKIYHTAPRFSEVFSLSLKDMLEAPQIYGTASFRRDLFERMGGFDSNLVTAEDYDFWLRSMAAGAKHIYCPDVLALYRVTPGQKTENAIRSRKSDIAIIKKLLATNDLTPEEVEQAQKTIAILEKNVAFRERVTALVGPRMAKPIFKLAHRAAWFIRPHRRAR